MRLLALVLAFALALCAADLSGTYKGTWSGGAANGDITFVFTAGSDSPKADVTFTVQGQDVKCNVTSVKVDGNKIDIVYTFDLGDTKLQSAATGELSGKTLQGTYKTTVVADGSAVDEGTWKAAMSN